MSNVYVFNSTNNCPIYVPCESVNAYKTADIWSNYASRIYGAEYTRTVSTATTCVGFDKYSLTEYQVSCNGSSWTTTTSFTGSLIESDSEDCGYIPPTPTGGTKFSATYSGGTTYTAECDSSTELTTATTRPSGYDKEKMLSAVVGDCVTSIGDGAFYYCIGLTSIDIPDSVTSIGEQAFEDCISLANINIPSGVTSIGNLAFENCSSLTSIDIPNSVTSIGNSAFQSCSGLTSCTIGSGVTSIGYYVFQDCSSLSSIVIPSGVTSIGDGAFKYCYGLTSIDIPDSVTSIGDWVFYECTGLTSIVIPSGVTSIGIYAFADCSSLSSITVNAATPPTLDNVYVFDNTNNCPILVPSQSVDTYKTASEWSTYADRIQAIN